MVLQCIPSAHYSKLPNYILIIPKVSPKYFQSISKSSLKQLKASPKHSCSIPQSIPNVSSKHSQSFARASLMHCQSIPNSCLYDIAKNLKHTVPALCVFFFNPFNIVTKQFNNFPMPQS